MVAAKIHYVGSVKWLGSPFDGHDLAGLQRGAMPVPGYEHGSTALGAVSAGGISPEARNQLGLCWEPAEVVAAYA